MNKKINALFSVLLIAAFALTACGGGTGSTATGEVTFWHAYGTGSAEETALTAILEKAKTDLPNVTINVLQVPFDQIYTKYRTEVASGGGPDMFIAPNDSLGDDARAGLLADITELASGKLGDYTKLSVDGMSVDGKLYGVPESLKAVASGTTNP